MTGIQPDWIKPPPRDSRAIVAEHADGFTITMPPRGLLRGGGWAMVIGTLLMLGLTVLLAVNSYYNIPTSRGVPEPQIRYVPPLVTGVVTLGLMLAMIKLGRYRVVLSVVRGWLQVEATQPLSPTKQAEWPRSQLFAICAGPDGKLEIYPRGRPRFTLSFPGTGLELEWLAGVLRRELQLDAHLRPPTTGCTAVTEATSAAADPAEWVAAEAKHADNWIVAGCAGALLATLVWWAFDRASSRSWSTMWLYPVAGVAVGVSGALACRGLRRRYVRRLGEISRSMNLAFQPTMSREDIGDFFYLRLFRGSDSTARNRMTGKVQGLFVDVFDYTFAVGGGKSRSTCRQTVMLLPAPEAGLPAFELRPRRGDWLGGGEIKFVPEPVDYREQRKRLGKQGYQLFLRQYARDRPARECKERFSRYYAVHRYYLSDYFQDAALWKFKGRADTGLPADRAGSEEDIRALFSLDVLRYFADHPGWWIESDGRHLALWRSRRFLSAARRPGFVNDALEVYRVLKEALPRSLNPQESRTAH